MIRIKIKEDMSVEEATGLTPGQPLLITLWDSATIKIRRVGKDVKATAYPVKD